MTLKLGKLPVLQENTWILFVYVQSKHWALSAQQHKSKYNAVRKSQNIT